MDKSEINIFHLNDVLDLKDFDNKNWKTAESAIINKEWSGAAASPDRHASARLLWSNEALFIRFDCEQHEPFVINSNPHFDKKTNQLWEQDVCELFIAPNAQNTKRYFEFEVAPTGEWLDLAICQFENHRETDWTYTSGMKPVVQIYLNSFTIIFQINWKAFGQTPRFGDRWSGNLFRCVGSAPSRGYLAWQPTLTETPNFHVPQAFGQFNFVKNSN